MIRALVILAALAAAAPARADAPPEVAVALEPEARRLGAEDVRFWGFRLYRAELWTQGEEFDFADPFALTLTYRRGFSAEALARASVKEMARISGRPEAAFAAMESELSGCFADVEEGDRITGVSHGPDRASFHLNGAPTCEVAREDFARDFFGIWLGEGTRDPAARDRLLGRAR